MLRFYKICKSILFNKTIVEYFKEMPAIKYKFSQSSKKSDLKSKNNAKNITVEINTCVNMA